MELNDDTVRYLSRCPMKKLKKNFQFLGEGIARKVFQLDDEFVIKVAKNEDGYHQNFVERYVYANCSPKIKRYLCPIIYSDDKIIIMAKAEPYNKILGKHDFVDPRELRDEKNVMEDLKNLIEQYHLFAEDIFAARSWGVINDKFYLIDFGCTSDYGDMFYDSIKAFYYSSRYKKQLLNRNL